MHLPRSLVLSALAACSARPAPDVAPAASPPAALAPEAPSAASAAAPSAAPAASSAAPAASSFAPHERAPDGPAPFSEAVADHRVFRQIIVGALPYPGSRLSWTLDQGAKTARLQVGCEVAEGAARARVAKGGGVRLDGSEAAADLWVAGGSAEAVGKKSSDKPLTYLFEVREQSATARACGPLPRAFSLICKSGSVLALAPGARLVVGQRRGNEESPSFRWQPPGTSAVRGLICEAKVEGEEGARGSALPGSWDDWKLVFSADRPVEWAHENSDMVVQTGAYRRLP